MCIYKQSLLSSVVIDGNLESTFINALIRSYGRWIYHQLVSCYDASHWQSQSKIFVNIKKYYNVIRIREHMKEVLLGHFHQHNIDVENVLMKDWQNDYYADAAVSSIRHKMGPNIGIFVIFQIVIYK